jgi:hypothetical protein
MLNKPTLFTNSKKNPEESRSSGFFLLLFGLSLILCTVVRHKNIGQFAKQMSDQFAQNSDDKGR